MIYIIEDDENIRNLVQVALNGSGYETAAFETAEEALGAFKVKAPQLAIFDLMLPGMDGLEASRKILGEFPEAKILLLTTFSDDEYIVKALRLGTKGYLLKQDHTSILPALQAVYSGQTVFGTEIISKIPELLQSSDGFDYVSRNISERELDIIRLIANGYSNKEIAAELFLSEGTVRNYLSSILDKLQLRDRTQVAVFYYQHK